MRWLINQIKHSPGLQLILTFLGLIIVGQIALYYYGFQVESQYHSLLNSLFLSTSAVCVTGLSPVDITKELNEIGHLMILLLIQLGGLGIVTLSNWLLLTIRGKLTTFQNSYTGETFGRISRLSMNQLLKNIIFFTLIIEFLGAILLYFIFSSQYSSGKAIWLAIFHSVSAFCNAGFSLFPDSLMSYHDNIPFNIIIMFLIITGGVGFLVVSDIFDSIKNRFANKRVQWALQTKVVILSSVLLILAGTLFIAIFEWNNLLKEYSISTRIISSLFLSVTPRTAGFNTIDTAKLTNISLIAVIFLMIIGGTSGSTAGGIKTTTLAVFIALIKSSLRNRFQAEIFNRAIPNPIISKSLLVILYYFITVIFAVIILETIELNHGNNTDRKLFINLLFEVISALSTVGLSLDTTPNLTDGGKLVIVFCMIAGRIGPLALFLSIFGFKPRNNYQLAEEEIMVG